MWVATIKLPSFKIQTFYESKGVKVALSKAAAPVTNFVPFFTKQHTPAVAELEVACGLNSPISTFVAVLNRTYPKVDEVLEMPTIPSQVVVYVEDAERVTVPLESAYNKSVKSVLKRDTKIEK